MPHEGLLFVSILCVVIAAAAVLFPKTLEQVSGRLNKTVTTIDKRLMKHRYTFAIVLFVVSYLIFRLALQVPLLRG